MWENCRISTTFDFELRHTLQNTVNRNDEVIQQQQRQVDTESTYVGQDGPHRVYLQFTAQPIVNGL